MKKNTVIILFIVLKVFAFAQSPTLDSLKRLLKATNNDTMRCNLLNAMIENEEVDSIWSGYNEQVMKISEQKLNSLEKNSTLRNFYLVNLAGALNNKGYLIKFQGDIPKAIEYYHQSLRLYEQIGDKINASNTLNNIGFIHKDQGDHQKALDAFMQNLKLYHETGNESGECLTLNNIGIVYSDLHKFNESLEYYDRCLKLAEKIKNKKTLAYALNNVGFVYYKQANTEALNDPLIRKELLEKGLEYSMKSLKVREEVKEKRGIALSLQNIAEALLDLGRVEEAKQYAEKSLQIANEIGYPDNIKRASQVLSKIYSKTNRWQQAYEMQVLFKQMSDSLSNETNRKLSIQKGFQIEYEKKVAADSVKTLEERKVFDAQIKQERTQRFALYGGLILVGLFGAFMFNRFKITQKQNHLISIQKTELQRQKEVVEEHRKEIIDSIHYAKRIQNALIANSDFIEEHVKNNFILFQPKDIVSGDFYWATKHNNKFYLAVCDCTGHGVPGAFMSLLNMGFLSEAIKEKNIQAPNEIFNYVRGRVETTMSSEGQKDGMDGILICIDRDHNKIQYVAANNEPILIRNGQVIELPKDKMPVGKGEKASSFTAHEIDLSKDDALYLYTDGYADQFGGPKGKKFKYKQLNDLLLANCNRPMTEQLSVLQTSFENWKGSLEQVDDVLLIGIKI